MSKIRIIGTLFLFATLVLTFIAGSLAYRWALEGNGVPLGSWVTLYSSDDSVVQINTSASTADGSSVTTWIREDTGFFLKGAKNHTVLSKITVDCKSKQITIHEQRGFSNLMKHILTIDRPVSSATAVDLATSITSLALCGKGYFNQQDNSLDFDVRTLPTF